MSSESEQYVLTPVIKRLPFDGTSPSQAYSRIAGDEAYSFVLESAEGSSTVARYSFIGADPRFILSASGSRIEIQNGRASETIPGQPVHFLRSHFDRYKIEKDADLPPFLGGAIGYIGFDCVSWFERTLNSDDAEAALMFFDSVVVFDHLSREVLFVTLSGKDAGFRDLHKAQLENERLAMLFQQTESQVHRSPIISKTPVVRSNFDRCDFERSVDEIKQLINKGECYQVVLSQRFERPTCARPMDIYENLRSMNPSPYMYLLRLGARSIVGSSPETLVTARGENLRYRPIAGTRPRGNDPASDERLAQEMRADPKEVAEHMMLVDLGRNDLGRVAEFGSVKVDRLMDIEKFSHVQHLVSDLYAKLDPRFDRFDVLASCFPAGTVSGAPKVRSIEVIRDLEPGPRGVYAGTIGYFDYAGNMDTCIAIRTTVLENNMAKVQAGAGIVADSVPSLEYEETVNKAAAMLKAIDAAEGPCGAILENLRKTFERGGTFHETEAERILDALAAETDEALLASVFVAWNEKGIDEGEIYSIAKIMRERCIPVHSDHNIVLDIVGTGGSKVKRFNVSTAAAFVIAGAGFPVAKHGNKAATSNSGSADVLSSLGVRCVDPTAAERCLERLGVCFMFAPNHHRLSPTLGKVRRSLGFPTIFNCVGPLCNPAGSQYQLIGAWSEEIAVKMASALARLRTKRSWIVHGRDGLDEISSSGKTSVLEICGNEVRRFEISPVDFGIEMASATCDGSETPESSSQRIRSVLGNEKHHPELRALVLLNAAAAIALAGDKFDLKAACNLATTSLESGNAIKKLNDLTKETSQ